jgi:antitoxin HigA-1
MPDRPQHPGQVIRDLCLKPCGLSVTDTAKGLGVSRKALSELLNGKAGILAEMAIRLSKAFGHDPEHSMHMQVQYDLWSAAQHPSHFNITSFTNIVWKEGKK